MVEASQRRRTLIRMRSVTTAIKMGHIKNNCWEKYPEKKLKFAKNCESKQASKSSIPTAAIEDSKGEIILAATTHGEQYVISIIMLSVTTRKAFLECSQAKCMQ
jgi:hypothetical protein